MTDHELLTVKQVAEEFSRQASIWDGTSSPIGSPTRT